MTTPKQSAKHLDIAKLDVLELRSLASDPNATEMIRTEALQRLKKLDDAITQKISSCNGAHKKEG